MIKILQYANYLLDYTQVSENLGFDISEADYEFEYELIK